MDYEDCTKSEIDAELAHIDAIRGSAAKLVLDAQNADFKTQADLEDFYGLLQDLISDHLDPLVSEAENAYGQIDAAEVREHIRHERMAFTVADKRRIANTIFGDAA